LFYPKFKHARLERYYTVSLLNDIWNFDHLARLFLAYSEVDMHTTIMGTLVISVYKKYGAVLYSRYRDQTNFVNQKPMMGHYIIAHMIVLI